MLPQHLSPSIQQQLIRLPYPPKCVFSVAFSCQPGFPRKATSAVARTYVKSLFILSLSFVTCTCSSRQQDERHTPIRPHLRVIMATHPGSLQSCGRPRQGQRASEENSMPDHNTAACSLTPNSKPTAACEQPRSKPLVCSFSQQLYCTSESQSSQTCEHASELPEP
jgi:hypothetical protein